MRSSTQNHRAAIHFAGTALLLGTLLFVFPFVLMGMQEPTPAHSVADGEQVYMTRCMSCHQQDGAGIAGVFPPVNESDWVLGDKGRLIRIILHGLSGEIKVNDVAYSGAMPPWGTFLNDADIAAVLTYTRSSWNNDAAAVTVKEVELVREATKDRKKPWTEAEFEDEANLGIPGVPNFSFPGLSPQPDTTSGNR